MRLGECQALTNDCVFDGYVDVRRSFARKYGFKEPKLGSFRKVPLPTRTSACEVYWFDDTGVGHCRVPVGPWCERTTTGASTARP